jgi:hypothetical protein
MINLKDFLPSINKQSQKADYIMNQFKIKIKF